MIPSPRPRCTPHAAACMARIERMLARGVTESDRHAAELVQARVQMRLPLLLPDRAKGRGDGAN